VPTARMLLPAMAATPSNWAPSAGEGFGLETMVHFMPFQCSIKGMAMGKPPAVLVEFICPTAHTLLLARAVTPFSSPPNLGSGLVTTLQRVPLKCSMFGSLFRMALSVVPLPTVPTAQMSLEATAAVALRMPLKFGLVRLFNPVTVGV